MGNSIFEYLLNKINKINLATKSVTTIDPRIELSFDFDDNNCPVYKIKIDGQDRFWVYADNYGADTNAVRIFWTAFKQVWTLWLIEQYKIGHSVKSIMNWQTAFLILIIG